VVFFLNFIVSACVFFLKLIGFKIYTFWINL